MGVAHPGHRRHRRDLGAGEEVQLGLTGARLRGPTGVRQVAQSYGLTGRIPLGSRRLRSAQPATPPRRRQRRPGRPPGTGRRPAVLHGCPRSAGQPAGHRPTRGPDASGTAGWRKSSYSKGEGAACIEVADGWSAFVAAVKRGGFRA
ncbi:DUF397 domain-containing protein [Streptomyces sp. NRRL S-1448]|uniref:DUF397 domain-containing protein n=1 Tax=Streptomyces sp. NRRL S-1448 TaxID=1463883 RepID=UPI002D21927C|nr:DUF397 domain-containing protein [Streptomyces sp. NRRL S-1448]